MGQLVNVQLESGVWSEEWILHSFGLGGLASLLSLYTLDWDELFNLTWEQLFDLPII